VVVIVDVEVVDGVVVVVVVDTSVENAAGHEFIQMVAGRTDGGHV